MLLNNGGYDSLERVSFPVEVEATVVNDGKGIAFVYGKNLNKIGKGNFD